jgi:hypothetical protein
MRVHVWRPADGETPVEAKTYEVRSQQEAVLKRARELHAELGPNFKGCCLMSQQAELLKWTTWDVKVLGPLGVTVELSR